MRLNRIELMLLQRDQSWSREEWIVPLSVALDGVTADAAAWEPQGGGNSIWQTVRHINYYNGRMLARLTGEEPGQGLETNEATFEGSGGAKDEEGWRKELAHTHALAGKLREAIAALADDDLEKPFGSSTFGEELAAWLLHDGYHSGQVVLIRKQLGVWRS